MKRLGIALCAFGALLILIPICVLVAAILGVHFVDAQGMSAYLLFIVGAIVVGGGIAVIVNAP